MKIKRDSLLLFISTFSLLLLFSCKSLQRGDGAYLRQAVKGHFKIMNARQSIDKIIAAPATNTETRDKLQMILDVRRFASERLKLPQNKSYTVYADIESEYPGWNVYAVPEFSTEPIVWCFPVAGCVVYRGYFDKEDALQFAAERKAEGLDVYVGAFSAYSSLGWFKDPILSNHLRLDSINLAGLIIHELAHQQFYMRGDSRFNEAFAVTVEREGTRAWLRETGADSLLRVAEERWQNEDRRMKIYLEYKDHLNEMYNSGANENLMREKKDSLFREMLADLRTPVNGKRPVVNKEEDIHLNNANLVPVSTYHQLLPWFTARFEEQDGDFVRFYEYVKKVSKMKAEEREKLMEEI